MTDTAIFVSFITHKSCFQFCKTRFSSKSIFQFHFSIVSLYQYLFLQVSRAVPVVLICVVLVWLSTILCTANRVSFWWCWATAKREGTPCWYLSLVVRLFNCLICGAKELLRYARSRRAFETFAGAEVAYGTVLVLREPFPLLLCFRNPWDWHHDIQKHSDLSTSNCT